MAKRRIRQRGKKSNKKNNGTSSYASLCALAPMIKSRGIFDTIHEKVSIQQKTIKYRSTDKLVFVVLGIMSGCEVVYDLNRKLRVDRLLLRAFGYQRCADQSVIQDTLDAATEENVKQLEDALRAIWDRNNLAVQFLDNTLKEGSTADAPETVDMDLSGMPASRNAECSTKGYFAGEKSVHGRQLARILFPGTQEIIAEKLYPGNITSCKAFKAMVKKMEQILPLDTKEKRSHIRLRLDGGFGTEENINYALWRGYHLLTRMYSGNKARVLAGTVHEWVDISPGPDNRSRQAGWVTRPHRYCRCTRQLAIRMLKKEGSGYQYSVIVTTDMKASIQAVVDDYDGRSGVPESSFCQDNQGLGNRKRRKRSFLAQQMLTLLTQLAHNLIRWVQNWMANATKKAAEIMSSWSDWRKEKSASGSEDADTVARTLNSFGMKRFVCQVLCLSGQVTMKKGKVVRVSINPSYPLVERIRTAFEALLKPYGIGISLGEI